MLRIPHLASLVGLADRLVVLVVLARVVAWLVSGKDWRSASGW